MDGNYSDKHVDVTEMSLETNLRLEKCISAAVLLLAIVCQFNGNESSARKALFLSVKLQNSCVAEKMSAELRPTLW